MDEDKLSTLKADVDDLKRQVQELWQRLNAISTMLEERHQH